MSVGEKGASMLIDESMARKVIGPTPLLDDGDYAELLDSANSDATEGVDWLPWYKLSLGLVTLAFGGMAAIVDEGIAAVESTDPDLARRMIDLRREAMGIVALSMRASGIGPNTSPENVSKVEAIIAEQWHPLMEGPPNG